MTQQITQAQATQLLKATNGRFFRATFVKRTNGQERVLVGRTGVTKHLTGGDKRYSFSAKNLLSVWDVQAKGYRTVPLDALISLRVDGQDYEVLPEGA